MQIARTREATQRLDPESAAILEWLMAGLVDPFAGHGLVSEEFGHTDDGGPTVLAERLSADRYLVARYIELDMRTEDPEIKDRVVAPEVEFVRQGSDWFPVVAQRGRWDGDERDLHGLAAAMLRTVAREQSLRPAKGLVGRIALYMWKRSRTRVRLFRRSTALVRK